MRHLLLLRHARAAGAAGGDDHERALTAEGLRDARRPGALLAQGDLRLELALCSSARRARETLEAVRSQLDQRPAVEVERSLYLADERALLERLAELDDGWGVVLLVGHNPAIGELARWLAGRGEAGALSRLRRGMPAGTLATLRLERGGWAELAPGGSTLLDLLPPDEPA